MDLPIHHQNMARSVATDEPPVFAWMAIFWNQRRQHWMLLYLLLATTVTGTSNDDQPLWIFWLRSKFSALAPPLKVGFFVWQTVFVQLSLRKVQVTEPGREKPLGCSLV